MYYEGRIQKLVSLAAAQASVYFNKRLQEFFEDNTLPFGIFDARIMQFPNEEEALNCLLFRQRDHIRNSISGYAQYYFSHKELTGKNSDEKIEMMLNKYKFNWHELNDTLNWSKYGTFLTKALVQIIPKDKEPYLRHTMIEKTEALESARLFYEQLADSNTLSYSEAQWQLIKTENE
jgi:tRNA(His) 5'-end guanylyltransferase